MANVTGRRRSRRWAGAIVAMVIAAVSVNVGFAVPSPAGSKGSSLMKLLQHGPYSYVYRQGLDLSGTIQDASVSCLGFAGDCDNPRGSVTVYTAERAEATSMLEPLSVDFGTFSMTIPGDRLAPGHYDIAIIYSGDFDAAYVETTLDVLKNPCTMTLYRSWPSTRPGDPVTFTAVMSGSTFTHSGTISFTDDQGLLATQPIADEQASFTTSALPQGDTTVTATFAGNGAEDACTASATHTVEADPPPVATDDSYSTEVGVPITVHPMENDADLGGGAIRAEYLSEPEFGEIDGGTGTNGDTLIYTPPDGFVGHDSVTYVVYDSVGQASSEATIDFAFGCTPEAADDSYATTYGEPLVVGGDGVTGNDATCDLPTEVVDQPAHGTVAYDGQTGGFTYTPAPGFLGDDSFTYQYAQGLETPVSATVDLFVDVPPPPPPTASEAAVTAWYQALLGRSPDSSGLAHWAGLVDGGASRYAIARQLLGSAEGRRRVVAEVYLATLGRPADSDGLAFWAGLLARGRTPDDLRVGLLSSSEGWAIGGGQAAGWADVVYGALLGRPASPTDEAWVAGLLASGTRRAQVVSRVARSPEARRHLAALWYDAILGRAPTPTEAQRWADAMAEGARELTLVAELASTLQAPPPF